MTSGNLGQTLDGHAVCFQETARRRGLETGLALGSSYSVAAKPRPWVRVRVGGKDYFFNKGALLDGSQQQGQSLGRSVNHAAKTIARDKMRTKQVLEAAGISVPKGQTFNRATTADALAFAATLGGPICIKPNKGSYGVLTFPERRTSAAIATAFAAASARTQEVLVEQSVPGEVIRYFYVHPRAVAVKISRPPTVEGDGESTIEQLIGRKNAERIRRALPGHPLIRIDQGLLDTIAEQDCDLYSIPALRRTVRLRLVSNGAGGGESIECADEAHPSYRAIAEATCAAIPGLVLSAIDMKVVDHRQPAAPGNHWILEVNSNPGILPYHYPWEGRPQNVCDAILDFLLRGGTATG